MNKYRLDVNPSSYYASQFRPEKIEVLPRRPAGLYQLIPGRGFEPADPSLPFGVRHLAARPEQGAMMIKGPVDFAVFLPSKAELIRDEDIDAAREVLDRIAEMDAIARAAWADSEDYEEELAYVEIRGDEVCLHYVANTCNTEWDFYFWKHPDGAWRLNEPG